MTAAFDVTNPTSEVVEIMGKHTSCGCASAELTSTRIPPEGKVELRLAANVGGWGSDRKYVTCDLETQNGQKWRYGFRADVYSRLSFEPRQLFLGQIDPGTVVEKTVQLVGIGRSEADLPKPSSWDDDSDDLEVSIGSQSKTQQLPSGVWERTTPVSIQIRPQSAGSSSRAEIRATCKAGNREAEQGLSVVWSVRSLYRIEPQRIFFGTLTRDSPAQRAQLQVSRFDDVPFRIVDVTSTHPSVRVVRQNILVDEARPNFEIEVEFVPSNVDNVLFAELVVRTDDAIQSEIRVTLTAIVRPA